MLLVTSLTVEMFTSVVLQRALHSAEAQTGYKQLNLYEGFTVQSQPNKPRLATISNTGTNTFITLLHYIYVFNCQINHDKTVTL